MNRIASLALAASLGLALTASANAQNYAPSVNYQAGQQDTGLTGRSVFVAPAPRLSRAARVRAQVANPAPLGYEGAIPAGD